MTTCAVSANCKEAPHGAGLRLTRKNLVGLVYLVVTIPRTASATLSIGVDFTLDPSPSKLVLDVDLLL